MDLRQINRDLRYSSPSQIMAWALSQAAKPMLSTSFGKQSSALLNLATRLAPRIPVIWVDHGYNVAGTYQYADKITRQLNLDLYVYSPVITTERRQALYGGVPLASEPEAFKEFVYDVKLEPFARAIAEHQPDVWITGIRKEETPYREKLDIVTMDSRGILKVAPFFYWSEKEVAEYIENNDLAIPSHYFDPTKMAENAECGLHRI